MSVCARCGANFGCAMVDGVKDAAGAPCEPCWCTRLPAVVPVPGDAAGGACWCPACLEQHIAAGAQRSSPQRPSN